LLPAPTKLRVVTPSVAEKIAADEPKSKSAVRRATRSPGGPEARPGVEVEGHDRLGVADSPLLQASRRWSRRPRSARIHRADDQMAPPRDSLRVAGDHRIESALPTELPERLLQTRFETHSRPDGRRRWCIPSRARRADEPGRR
jgi:hypothetical protein